MPKHDIHVIKPNPLLEKPAKPVTKLDLDVAKRIQALLACGLVEGIGSAEPGEMCVEAAICYALGEDHGDVPSCVAGEDRMFKITLNDCVWSSNDARGAAFRRIAVQQLGTKGKNRTKWINQLRLELVRDMVPEALVQIAKDLVAAAKENQWIDAEERRNVEEGAVKVRHLAKKCQKVKTPKQAYTLLNRAYEIEDAEAFQLLLDDAELASAVTALADLTQNGADDAFLTRAIKCAERAYEKTGSPGVKLLRQLEAAEKRGSRKPKPTTTKRKKTARRKA